MCRSGAKAALVLLSLLIFPTDSGWADCSSPPSGFGNAWESRYRSWCSGCCGTPTGSGPQVGCDPGSNWGCGGSGGGSAGGGGTADFAGQMSQILLDAAARTGAAAKRSRALGQAGAAQVNSEAKRASDSVGIRAQDQARQQANERVRKSLQLQNELQGLPPASLETDITIPPEVSGAVVIAGETPMLMGGDPFDECSRPPDKRRWDVDCPRVANAHTDGYAAQWGRANTLGGRWAGLLEKPRSPTTKLEEMKAKLSEYLYSESVAKAKGKAEEYIKSLGPTGEAVVRVVKTRSILQTYAKDGLRAIDGQMNATVCSVGSIGPGCDEAFYKNVSRFEKATETLQDDSESFLKDELGIEDSPSPPGWWGTFK